VPVAPAPPAELARHAATISSWLSGQLATNPVVVAVDHDPALRRWYLRMRGEERDFVAVWLTLGEYTLAVETYLAPAPEENAAALYEFLLRRNRGLYGMAFAIGDEDAVYLVGHTPLSALSDDELDRVVGSAYAYVEQWFRPAMRIGFASKFKG
jgi:Putative bacterial sensory transduction regulator